MGRVQRKKRARARATTIPFHRACPLGRLDTRNRTGTARAMALVACPEGMACDAASLRARI
jgi:hypothetical protein